MKKITIITGLVILLCSPLNGQDAPDPAVEVRPWQAIPGMGYPSTVAVSYTHLTLPTKA